MESCHNEDEARVSYRHENPPVANKNPVGHTKIALIDGHRTRQGNTKLTQL